MIADDFPNEGKLPLCDLVLDGRDVAEVRADGGVGDVAIDHLGDGDAEAPADAVVKEHLEFLEQLLT